MSFFRDKQVRRYIVFLIFFSSLFIIMYLIFNTNQIDDVKTIYITHNQAVASSLLEQGVSKEIIANAITNNQINESGKDLLNIIGIDRQTVNHTQKYLSQYQQLPYINIILIAIFLILITIETFVLFYQRNRLYLQADKIINNYINNDYSSQLPKNREGTIFQLFSSIEKLATMLQSKNEMEHKTKEFLKNTISDISHQLKTPIAAITMYQEIISNEPNNVQIVKEFSAKIETALNRMKQLIEAMLKITRLDTGNIVFNKCDYHMTNLISNSISELTFRAKSEKKKIIIDGNPDQIVNCDFEWTSEAIGNIIKNALDHTKPGDIIRISWENTPAMLRIFITDNGSGIAPEDIHHIFKRFYRSKYSLETQGIGLGLSLAKSIIEGQNGMLLVKSELNKGTTFTIAFLTK